MLALSMFKSQSPPANEATPALTFFAVLDILKNRHFISAEFAQKILEHSSPPSAPKISLAAIEAARKLGDIQASQPETDLCMDISYFTDEDETPPEQETKRFRCDS
ncbi:MAG: hypothetical protein GW760_03315 [Legionella sp.]|nr:hypothetical protein [Legionella sp.]